MPQSSPHNPAGNKVFIALCANAVLLLCILLVLISGGERMPSLLSTAQAQMPAIGGAGVFIVPAQFTRDNFGCYLLDVDAQTVVAYQFYPGEKQLRLIAARGYRYDRRLTNFNTGAPSPEEVRSLLEKEAASGRVLEAAPPAERNPEF